MENKEFKWDYTLDLKTYNEFTKGYLEANIIRKILRLIVVIYLTYYFMICYHTKSYGTLIFFAVFFVVIFLIVKIVNKSGNIQFKRMLSINKGQPIRNEINVNDEGIHAINLDTENKNDYTFEQILSVTETNNLFILKLKYRMGLIVNKNTLTGGSKEEFLNFMFDKCVNIKRKKVKTTRNNIVFKIIWIFFAILIILGTSYQYRDRRTYSLELPETQELTSIRLEQGAEGKMMKDYESMDDILDVLNGVKRITQEQSIQDSPVNAEDEIKIDIDFRNRTSTIFVYKKRSKYYIEQPYNGIYKISEEEYNKILGYIVTK